MTNVSLRCDSFETAFTVAARNYDLPPDGYRLNGFQARRRNHSGRRVTLVMEFMHIDRRIAQLNLDEAEEVFELDAQVALGLAEYPKED
jgi:hypothetical protein